MPNLLSEEIEWVKQHHTQDVRPQQKQVSGLQKAGKRICSIIG